MKCAIRLDLTPTVLEGKMPLFNHIHTHTHIYIYKGTFSTVKPTAGVEEFNAVKMRPIKKVVNAES